MGYLPNLPCSMSNLANGLNFDCKRTMCKLHSKVFDGSKHIDFMTYRRYYVKYKSQRNKEKRDYVFGELIILAQNIVFPFGVTQ